MLSPINCACLFFEITAGNNCENIPCILMSILGSTFSSTRTHGQQHLDERRTRSLKIQRPSQNRIFFIRDLFDCKARVCLEDPFWAFGKMTDIFVFHHLADVAGYV